MHPGAVDLLGARWPVDRAGLDNPAVADQQVGVGLSQKLNNDMYCLRFVIHSTIVEREKEVIDELYWISNCS
ncbi:MAG: hypothetical protein ACKOET_07845, partial [Verrucomicrobiota bacterium]